MPEGYEVPEDSLSPDGNYGVTVPNRESDQKIDDPKNRILDIKTGRVVAEIDANVGWDQANHESVQPARWSANGGLLLWTVDGKWFPWALVLVKLQDGKASWQLDLLKLSQEAILARTKEAAPQEYARAKKQNAGNGSAYPEGFSVDVTVPDPIALPLKIKVALTSDPKGIREDEAVNSHLEAEVDKEGKFVVKSFGLGPGESSHF